MIYSPIKGKVIWRTRYSIGLYALCNELDIVKVMKRGRMRWLEHVFRMKVLDPCEKLTVLELDGTRRVGKRMLR